MLRRGCLLVLIFVLALIAGCGGVAVPTGQTYFSKAETAYSQGDYDDAIKGYQNLLDLYPFSAHAEEAELKIGLAQYKQGHYAEAIASLSDFERMHPTSKYLAMVTYSVAMANYKQMRRVDQDQARTRDALGQFELVEQRFPDSGFAELARQQIVICREMLARHDILVGNFYYSWANYRAAESRYAQLLEEYPDTPVAPEALYRLATTFQKEGKKYSAAQAYAALTLHYPSSVEVAKAKDELKRLGEPVDNEADPLALVLAESGFVAQRDHPAQSDNWASLSAPSGGSPRARDERLLPSAGLAPASHKRLGQTVLERPAVLKTVRLSSSDPPLSVVLDLSNPVPYADKMETAADLSTFTVHLKHTTPDARLEPHLVFNRSIFKDCTISSDKDGTTVTVNTVPVLRFAVVPLEEPARLLITFTPRAGLNPEESDSAS